MSREHDGTNRAGRAQVHTAVVVDNGKQIPQWSLLKSGGMRMQSFPRHSGGAAATNFAIDLLLERDGLCESAISSSVSRDRTRRSCGRGRLQARRVPFSQRRRLSDPGGDRNVAIEDQCVLLLFVGQSNPIDLSVCCQSVSKTSDSGPYEDRWARDGSRPSALGRRRQSDYVCRSSRS